MGIQISTKFQFSNHNAMYGPIDRIIFSFYHKINQNTFKTTYKNPQILVEEGKLQTCILAVSILRVF